MSHHLGKKTEHHPVESASRHLRSLLLRPPRASGLMVAAGRFGKDGEERSNEVFRNQNNVAGTVQEGLLTEKSEFLERRQETQNARGVPAKETDLL